MSPWTLRSRLTVTRLLSCVSSLFYTACCHTYKKFTHTVDSSGETERHNSGIVDFPASHRLEAARPPTNLPPTSLLRGYRPQRVVWWLHRGMQHVPARARRRARSRAAQISPPARRPAAAPACGGLINYYIYTLVVTGGFSLYRIGLHVTLLPNYYAKLLKLRSTVIPF